MILYNGSGIYETSIVEREGCNLVVRISGLNIPVAQYHSDDRAHEVLGEYANFLDLDLSQRKEYFNCRNVYKIPIK